MRKLVFIVSLVLLVGTCHGMSLSLQQDSVWTLQKCIDRALNQNIQIRKSENANQRFGLYAEQAKAQRLPSVNASVSQNFNWSKSSNSGYIRFFRSKRFKLFSEFRCYYI
jgi:outer membrane protein